MMDSGSGVTIFATASHAVSASIVINDWDGMEATKVSKRRQRPT